MLYQLSLPIIKRKDLANINLWNSREPVISDISGYISSSHHESFLGKSPVALEKYRPRKSYKSLYPSVGIINRVTYSGSAMTNDQRTYDVDHELDSTDENIHTEWDNTLDPRLTIESGDVVRFECRDASNGQFSPDSSVDEVLEVDASQIHPMTGPVAIKGAQPGDVLEVELLEFEHDGWGYTVVYPGDQGKGLLPGQFPNPDLHIWELENDVAKFVDGIRIPVHPFPGNIGVVPAEKGKHSTIPPRDVGGNIDIKHLTAGSKLYLPIEVRDGMFSIGDCHAAQGDGEVCVTGIESPMTVSACLVLRQDIDIPQPRFLSDHPFTPSGQDELVVGTTGVGDDLMTASKRAVEQMIDHLHTERGLSRGKAYMLCSAAVDLKINEVVNDPNWTVSAYLPQSIFP